MIRLSDSEKMLIRPMFSRFYRAKHFSAERGLAITCRLSVCQSVRL